MLCILALYCPHRILRKRKSFESLEAATDWKRYRGKFFMVIKNTVMCATHT